MWQNSALPNIVCISFCFMNAVPPIATIASVSHPLFTMKCTVTGVPTSINWYHAERLTIYQSDEEHLIMQSLVNGTTATYESTLQFADTPAFTDTGVHLCNATTTYFTSGSSQETPIHATGYGK